jgi:hypothetical protein
MARKLFAALIALALLTTPAHAQAGRVLLDMTIQALPGSPSGHCLYVDAGRFVVEGHLVGDNHSPARFTLGPDLNVPASLNLRITSATTASTSTQVEAGVYCYTLTNEAPEPAGDNVTDQASPLEQLVAVRLLWLPAS